MTNYSGIFGMQVMILKSKRDGITRIRVLQDELTRAGEAGIAALADMKPEEIEILYRTDAEGPLAEAHRIILCGHGLNASVCPV